MATWLRERVGQRHSLQHISRWISRYFEWAPKGSCPFLLSFISVHDPIRIPWTPSTTTKFVFFTLLSNVSNWPLNLLRHYSFYPSILNTSHNTTSQGHGRTCCLYSRFQHTFGMTNHHNDVRRNERRSCTEQASDLSDPHCRVSLRLPQLGRGLHHFAMVPYHAPLLPSPPHPTLNYWRHYEGSLVLRLSNCGFRPRPRR